MRRSLGDYSTKQGSSSRQMHCCCLLPDGDFPLTLRLWSQCLSASQLLVLGMQALLLSHPVKLIRDTARYPPLMRPAQPGRKPKPRALRHLAFEELGLGIQEGEHSPVEDARSALYLYQKNAKVSCQARKVFSLFVTRSHSSRMFHPPKSLCPKDESNL